jgi:UDP-N-acetylmuramoyl-tripeptide--D-alanyl-D-alanine ligase
MSPNPFQTIIYQLYLLQLENFHLGRFIKTVSQKHSKTRRGKITWTKKLTGVTLCAGVLQVLAAFGIAKALPLSPLGQLLVGTISAYVLSFVFFVFAAIIIVLITPLDRAAKAHIMKRAKNKMSTLPNIKIIGIVGSYGKTTMKEMVATLLEEKYTVVKTPENINRNIGIARLIQKAVSEQTEVLIVEMGEYEQGDITHMCALTPPDITIITGINEAHIEQMGTIETIQATIFEAIDNTKENGTILVNSDSDHMDYKPHLKSTHKTYEYGKSANPLPYGIEPTHFHENGAGRDIALKKDGETIGTTLIPFLGDYSVHTLQGALTIAHHLELTNTEIMEGIKHLQPIPHRLQPLYNPKTNILVIDDSYNGNPDGVREAIHTLKRFTTRRKLYITPGLVELGETSKKIHYTIGNWLHNVADIVILIKNSATPSIEKGLKDNGYDEHNIIFFDTAPEAHRALKDMLQPNDVILFQNDWTDNYT